MNKNDIIHRAAKASGHRLQDAAEIINAAVDVLRDMLTEGESITVCDFGTLKPRLKPERIATDPRTGERIHVPARITVTFTPSESLIEGMKSE